MLRLLFRGLVAGAAGTMALNAATYADMAWRGRDASDTPQRTVEALAGAIKVEIPGDGVERESRLSGLGALSGAATGVAIGGFYSMIDAARWRVSPLLGAVVIGATAMAATNLTMAGLGVSDPRDWSMADWVSDAVPHMAFGAVTWAALRTGCPAR